jgi:MscS family membrane protein
VAEGVPLSSQPFYPALLEAVETWEGVPLGEVIGNNPRSTLLNFYVVMAEVGHQMRTISASARTDPGFNWSPAARQRIDNLNTRFNLAVEALDASEFAESVRSDRAEEAAMQLKQILDYVLSNSRKTFDIPNHEAILRLNESMEKDVTEWRLPGTAVVLSLDDTKKPIAAITCSRLARCSRWNGCMKKSTGCPHDSHPSARLGSTNSIHRRQAIWFLPNGTCACQRT